MVAEFYSYRSLARKKYMNSGGVIKYRDLKLSDRNNVIKQKMFGCNSVAIHIRRGDYLSPDFYNLYWHLEDTGYYQNALELVRNRFGTYSLFVFSDDMEWCKANLASPFLDEVIFIDWNKGDDSIYDMYLMSHAKANVIANSTFSFWGAYLNRRSELTIYPVRWYAEGSGFVNPDIFPQGWIGL